MRLTIARLGYRRSLPCYSWPNVRRCGYRLVCLLFISKIIFEKEVDHILGPTTISGFLICERFYSGLILRRFLSSLSPSLTNESFSWIGLYQQNPPLVRVCHPIVKFSNFIKLQTHKLSPKTF